MKKNKICLLLSILVVSCLFILPGKQVFAADADGGQVSVPGKIIFETEKDEDKPKPGPEPKPEPKPGEEIQKPNDTSGKKFYSVLPKTGETSSASGLLGFVFLIGAAGIVYRKKVGAQK